MYYSLNSIEGGYIGDYISGSIMEVIKGNPRSLDYRSHIEEH